MFIRKLPLLFFLTFSVSVFAEYDLELLEINERMPITKPINGYDEVKNSYPDPFSDDEIIFTIN